MPRGRGGAPCAAASRPDVKFVPAKTLEQQGVLALHSARSLPVKQQTMLANTIRSLATEFGLTVPKGIGKLREPAELFVEDETFPKRALQAIRALLRTTATNWLKASRHLRRRLSLMRGTINRIPPGHDPRRRSDHRVPDRGDSRRYRCVQKCTAVRRLARSSAATTFHRREDPAWADHQSGQPRDTHAAGARSHVDDQPRCTLEQRSWGLAQRSSGASPDKAGNRGASEQDGAHRMGVDDAQRGLPRGTADDRLSGSCSVTFCRTTVDDGRKLD